MLTAMSDIPDPTEVPTFDLPAWGTAGAPDLGTETETEVEIVVEPLAPTDIVVVTTETVPGARISSTLGVVAGEASAAVGDGPLETAIRQARTAAIDVLRRHATDAGAHAVVGLRTDMALRKSTVAVAVVGTAVELA